jgi:hypothetical protein
LNHQALCQSASEKIVSLEYFQLQVKLFILCDHMQTGTHLLTNQPKVGIVQREKGFNSGIAGLALKMVDQHLYFFREKLLGCVVRHGAPWGIINAAGDYCEIAFGRMVGASQIA